MRPVAIAARCCPRGVLWACSFGALTVGAGVLAGVPTAAGIAAIVTLTLLFFALHSAWRLAQGLRAFADRVPGQADVHVRASGRARLAWPSLNLDVQGRAGVLREPSLEAQAAGQPFHGDLDEAQAVAEEALASLGLEPRAAPGRAHQAQASAQ